MFRCIARLMLLALGVHAIDIIGYYGNSGNAVAYIPTFPKINDKYNIVIITFASIDASGTVQLDIQGPYQKNFALLASDILVWKQLPDPLGRKRKVLVSIGGQNGGWPSGLSPSVVEGGLRNFMKSFNLDGLDVDLEGQAVSAATSLIPVIKSLTASGLTVTAAPEASQEPLDAYKNILPLLTWMHPQFYNNGPNGVTTPYVPSAALWPTPWTVTDWQDEKGQVSFWGGVLGAIATANGMSVAQSGMLIPATPAAAGAYNHWDITKLAQEVIWSGIQHVGCWAIAYDNTQGYLFAETMAKVHIDNIGNTTLPL